ncbi:MAG: OmpA family protein [bacterium]|nr:OmpA family protein [bacterium]
MPKNRQLKSDSSDSNPLIAALIICLLMLSLGLPNITRAQDLTFDEVKALIEQASGVRAEVFSKNNYDDGLKAYLQADIDRQSGKSEKNIAKNLINAGSSLQKAIEASQLFQSTFPDLVSAYDGAKVVYADSLASKTYQDGYGYFTSVVSKIEKGDLEAARKAAESAQTSLRNAELEAIKVQTLSGVWDLQAQAQKAECPKETPTLFAAAQNALGEAERYIEADRYDRPAATRLAGEAGYAFQHAIFVTELIKKQQEDKTGWEPIILNAEKQLKDVSVTLALESKFDRDWQLSTQAIIAAIKSLQDERRRLQDDLAQRDQHIGELEADLGKLKGQSDQYLAELEVKREQIQKQRDFDEKVQRVTALFTPSEGSVIRTSMDGSDAIIIRLGSLIFPSGSSNLRKEDFPLLEKAKQAVTEFPDWKIEVQGHTDSQGDEAKNLKLSQDRADAVMQYIKLGLNLSDDAISAIGYGKTRPIAPNDTAPGRNQNRRIEIVLRHS